MQADSGRTEEMEEKEKRKEKLEGEQIRNYLNIHGYELRITHHKFKTQAYIDSGSSANFISENWAREIGVQMDEDGTDFRMADGTTVQMRGYLPTFRFNVEGGSSKNQCISSQD